MINISNTIPKTTVWPQCLKQNGHKIHPTTLDPKNLHLGNVKKERLFSKLDQQPKDHNLSM